MTTIPYLKPLPEITERGRPFWEGLRRHEFLVPKCNDCGDYNWVPYPACRSCLSEDQVWTKVSGGPLLLGVVTELMLSTVLALIYSASWTQLALGQSEAVSVQMEYLSRTDHLTKLGNRRSLYSHIEALMSEMKVGQEAALGKPAPASLLLVGHLS